MWDYSEAKYWQPALESQQTRFVPSGIVAPNTEMLDRRIDDMGKVVAIRSIYNTIDAELLGGYNPKEVDPLPPKALPCGSLPDFLFQILSLHESGFLTLWTMLDSVTSRTVEPHTRLIDHQSSWSAVKLVQSKIVDLRPRIQSPFRQTAERITSAAFAKTRSYFENDLFTDTALQELQSIDGAETRQLSDVRCVALEVNNGGVFVASSENFIIYGRRTLKPETFRKVQIDGRRNVNVQYFLPMSPKCDEILVALSDGTVKSFSYPSVGRLLSGSAEYGADVSISPLTFVPVNSPSNPGAAVGERTSSASAHSSAQNAGFSIGQELGKSCIIQNIVQNERKLYSEAQTVDIFESNEFKLGNDQTGGDRTADNSAQPEVVNNQLILFQPSKQRTEQQIAPLVKSHRLVSLRRNQVKVYNLMNDSSTNLEFKDTANGGDLIRIATAINENDDEYLVSPSRLSVRYLLFILLRSIVADRL